MLARNATLADNSSTRFNTEQAACQILVRQSIQLDNRLNCIALIKAKFTSKISIDEIFSIGVKR
jgi:hypothetical protein